MDIQEDKTSEESNLEKDSSGLLKEVFRTGVNHIEAQQVSLKQAGVNTINANTVSIDQGGVVNLNTETFSMTSGGVVFAQVQEANLTSSSAKVMVAGGSNQLKNSQALVLVSGNGSQLEQSSAAVLVTSHAKVDNASGVIFLIAKNVEGDVKTVFGPKESVFFGITAGFTWAIVNFIFHLIRKKRNPKKK